MLITVDSNVFINFFHKNDGQHENAVRLLSLAERGILEIQTTTRLDNDISRDPWKSMLQTIAVLSTDRVGAPGRVGSSSVGGGDIIVSESESRMLDQLLQLIFPGATKSDKKYTNKIHDVDHLFAHHKSTAIVFITSDVPILRVAGRLAAEFGINVSGLHDFLDANGWATENAE